MNVKTITIQILLILVVFFGSAEARGIEAGLGGISWESDTNQVQQALAGQGFVFVEQGNTPDGNRWERYGNGLFSGFLCDIKVVWQSKRLAWIDIESRIFLLGPESTYRKLVTQFAVEYGQPQETDRYMLKMYPGLWIEWAKWTVTGKGEPSFTVTVMQNSPAEAGSAGSGEIKISFQKISGK